ncbi:MAG: AbrB/MazE/SpoVT family DNA-binding domain-containing protein [Candidatus Aenigmarchaeota archaeon]|nr:AbrB/MazE/SpoVT family DNA-binding domain-containing protein [Candidatus Aenigmarchaeota archaeon]
MGVAITKISQNGQVVIPSDIRKNAGIKPSTQFIIFNEDGDIFLKQIKEKKLLEDFKLIRDIEMSEVEIKEGKFIEADTSMSEEEIIKLLEKD